MLEQLILNFRNEIEKEGTLLDSICLSNKNGLIWKKEYTHKKYHCIYSHAKSFTSLMVGIAIDEKKISLDTRLVDVFKKELSTNSYTRLFDITVKDLLTMSSGFDEALLMIDERQNGVGYPNYFNFILSKELKTKPGSRFCYSNGDTYLLGRIVEKVYDKKFVQLCYEKIFKPLDIHLPTWATCPYGYCLAASELYLNVEEINRLGVLFLNGGIYNGKRIISKEYIDMCSKPQIKTDENAWGDYSFQFWIVPEGEGYRADGAYGQITIIWPKHNLTLSFLRTEDEKLEKVLAILHREVLSKL